MKQTMQLKKILSNQAYWTINKELARDIGLDATVVLQHFVDLQSSFFEDGGFYQQQDRILKDLPLTIDYLRKAVKILVDRNFISVVKRGIPSKNHYTVNESVIMMYLSSISSSIPEIPLEVSSKDDKQYPKDTTNTKNIDTKNIDTKNNISDDDFYGKIFFKIVDLYPANRIGNRQHGLKKFKTLSKEDAKLAALNLKRYLKIASTFVKNLQNYITDECWSEAWLSAEETKQNLINKKSNSVTNNAKSFTNKNKGFYE